ncbi:MAG: Mrp/NBP35 family ATP-binding protein [Candidatus Heimdallarchaeota archaeon]|nr:Mrp/NBP35 family ATP-binding protein [Candidatus Heimdallarchaeota archaeon]MBY8995707.1 Mrp/NBP35 family ATP-binding protein [Candidatus Heimdallarchaeota archaeon]
MPAIDPMKAKIMAALKDIKHVLVVASGKGGVGKTTVAINLATSLAKRGFSVGILDADITGPNVPKMVGLEDERPAFDEDQKKIIPIESADGVKVISMEFLLENKTDAVIWRGPLKMGAINQFLGDVKWDYLDYLVIDLPPGTSDEPLSVAQMIPRADGVIIVTTPQEVALLDVKKSISFVKKVGMKVIGIVENMSGFKCPHCDEEINIFSKDGGKNAAKELNIPFLGAIPIDPQIVPLSDAGKPIVSSKNDTQKVFDKIVDNILAEIEK